MTLTNTKAETRQAWGSMIVYCYGNSAVKASGVLNTKVLVLRERPGAPWTLY